jgi:hypothetical protein
MKGKTMPAILKYLSKNEKILATHEKKDWTEAIIAAQDCQIKEVKYVTLQTDEWPNHTIQAQRYPNGHLDWIRVPNPE